MKGRRGGRTLKYDKNKKTRFNMLRVKCIIIIHPLSMIH